jgi:hypothetical protein
MFHFIDLFHYLNDHKLLFDTVAADSSPGMLEILKAKISEHGIKNVFPQHLDLHYDLT